MSQFRQWAARTRTGMRDSLAQADRDHHAAMALPWNRVAHAIIGTLTVAGGLIGLPFGFIIGIFVGGIVGGLLGIGLCGMGFVLISLAPQPWAALARRKGYAAR